MHGEIVAFLKDERIHPSDKREPGEPDKINIEIDPVPLICYLNFFNHYGSSQAERGGFEPPVPLQYNGLANRPLRPLGHLSHSLGE